MICSYCNSALGDSVIIKMRHREFAFCTHAHFVCWVRDTYMLEVSA